ncbi:hypothetical protein BC629DRAFT_1498768 [Irpex lacteus]|nr:hypothetical protein BC629DRAFT_1498768 [Irpex lacteus]
MWLNSTTDALVVMHGDSATDIRAFLGALYDSDSRYLMTIPTRDDIPRLVSILRTGTKYEAIRLRRRALDALQIYYPFHADAYQPLLDATTQRRDFIHHILIANVARETSLNELLPAALLQCCCTAQSSLELFDGVSDTDGTHHELLPANKRSVFIGRDKLGYTAPTRVFVRGIQSSSAKGCTLKYSLCGTHCQGLSKPYYLQKDRLLDPFSPFFSIHREELKKNCCEGCRSRWEMEYQKEMEELWRDLPTFFDLPSWSAILADDLAET